MGHAHVTRANNFEPKCYLPTKGSFADFLKNSSRKRLLLTRIGRRGPYQPARVNRARFSFRLKTGRSWCRNTDHGASPSKSLSLLRLLILNDTGSLLHRSSSGGIPWILEEEKSLGPVPGSNASRFVGRTVEAWGYRCQEKTSWHTARSLLRKEV